MMNEFLTRRRLTKRKDGKADDQFEKEEDYDEIIIYTNTHTILFLNKMMIFM